MAQKLTKKERTKLIGLPQEKQQDFYYRWSDMSISETELDNLIASDITPLISQLKTVARDTYIVNIAIPKYAGTEAEKRKAKKLALKKLDEIVRQIAEDFQKAKDDFALDQLYREARARGIPGNAQGIVDYILKYDEAYQHIMQRGQSARAMIDYLATSQPPNEDRAREIVEKANDIYTRQYTRFLYRAITGDQNARRLKDATLRRIALLEKMREQMMGITARRGSVFDIIFSAPVTAKNDIIREKQGGSNHEERLFRHHKSAAS